MARRVSRLPLDIAADARLLVGGDRRAGKDGVESGAGGNSGAGGYFQDAAQGGIALGYNGALAMTVANAGGVPLIAQFDLDKTVRPLLFPSHYISPGKITTICLDPGHGGKDPGAIGVSGALSSQDAQVATAGAAALSKSGM